MVEYPDLGIYYLNKGEFEKAAAFFKLALENPDENNIPAANIHTQLALAYLGVRGDKNYMITPHAIAQALPTAKQVPEAIDELNKALELDPSFYSAHNILAQIYIWKGDKEMAYDHYQKMITLRRQAGKL